MGKPTPLVILTAGGTARDALHIARACQQAGHNIEVVGFLDDRMAKGSLFEGLPVLGTLDEAQCLDLNLQFVDALGSPARYTDREARIASLTIPPSRFYSLVHPQSISCGAEPIPFGCLIYPGVIRMANATIGEHVTVLAGTVVHHDSAIGPWSIIAGGVQVLGNVKIGRSVYVGASSVIRQGLTIGDGALIGMGAVVVADVAPYSCVYGNPARPHPHPYLNS